MGKGRNPRTRRNEVDLVGGITCVAYGIVIPCCFCRALRQAACHNAATWPKPFSLGRSFQYFQAEEVLPAIARPSKIFFIACDDGSQGKVHLRLEFCEKSATFQEIPAAQKLDHIHGVCFVCLLKRSFEGSHST